MRISVTTKLWRHRKRSLYNKKSNRIMFLLSCQFTLLLLFRTCVEKKNMFTIIPYCFVNVFLTQSIITAETQYTTFLIFTPKTTPDSAFQLLIWLISLEYAPTSWTEELPDPAKGAARAFFIPCTLPLGGPCTLRLWHTTRLWEVLRGVGFLFLFATPKCPLVKYKLRNLHNECWLLYK